jgi:hypothetical protein
MLNQPPVFIDSVWRTYDRGRMQRRIISLALTFGIAAGTLIFTGCATTEARISQHPEMYQRLSSRDQSLVSQGQIRPGMTMDAVRLAWGTPDQKIPANVGDGHGETWVYVRYETPPSYGGPYYYGPFDWSYIPPKFVYPSRGVTFSNGRVVFFRYLPSPPPL